jgi:23S rRNA (uracil1939-C5)-methyltransferase
MSRPQRSAEPESAQVIDLDDEGRGVAKVQGKAVFITDALPDEHVQFIRGHQHRSFDEARLHTIVSPSPDRVAPGCEHFGVCGGCTLQHLASHRQIDFKHRQLLQALKRIGHVEPQQVFDPLQGPAFNYRRRARLGVRWVAKKNRALVGFRERNTKFLADVRRCAVLKAPADRLVGPLADLITTLTIRDQLPQIEVAVADNATALVIRILKPLTDIDLNNLRRFAAEHGVVIYLQPGGPATIAALDSPAPELTYSLPEFDVRFVFEPCDFIQINSVLNERMVSRAIELLEIAPTDRVLDLFCGLGNFSLPLARRAREVIGIEGDEGLVQRARANAARNDIGNAVFFVANLFQPDLSAPWARQPFDRVLLDPPRAGAREILPLIAKSGAHRIVYVSCHAGSLARDAGLLVSEHGYRLLAAGAMDMFPHTTHGESIAVFERASRR